MPSKPDQPTDDAVVEETPVVDPSAVVYPVGVYIGEGAERAWTDGVEYVVDPETGRITGPA